MFLTRIDPKTGLVDLGGTDDGIMAIIDFRKIIQTPKLGIECFTCIALTVDYLSPIHFYPAKERHIRAMKNITGKSNSFLWANDFIQKACLTYSDLQYNPIFEEREMLLEMRLAKLADIKDAADDLKKRTLFADLEKIKSLQDKFNKNTDIESALQESSAAGDYNLSRLEKRIIDKKSFYHEKRTVD